MTQLTSDQREYKERTLEQLQINLPLLETNLAHETRPDVTANLQQQIDSTKAHIDLLHHELATNTAGEPVATELYQRIANALTNKKFFLAKKLINNLETIEPFYPDIERLRQEAETGRASRRTQAIAQRGPATGAVPATDSSQAYIAQSSSGAAEFSQPFVEETEEKKGIGQFFQFHIILSCLVIFLILCVMMGIGGIMLLQWLIEGV